MTNKLLFASDYMEGAHPNIIKRLAETNYDKTVGYGLDPICESAAKRIRISCNCPEAKISFLVGGTQANATVIGSLLRPWEAALAADTGHIAVHEAGAIEFGGNKVLTIPHCGGKIYAPEIKKYLENYWGDDSHEHMPCPRMVYISQPTEYGSIYSLAELEAIKDICIKYNMLLYVDGARLAYAQGCPENDVTLPDLARLCDAFYIGGTKCGALLGEAVVMPDPDLCPAFFTSVKQHGALLAKGRLLGIQFDELFQDDLYLSIGKDAIEKAAKIKKAIAENGFELYMENPTNQVFFILDNSRLSIFGEQVEYSFWEKLDENRTVVRVTASWATTEADVDKLISIINSIK